MWRPSDEQRLRESLETLRHDCAPEDLRERLQADIETRFPRTKPEGVSAWPAGVGQAAKRLAQPHSLPVRLFRSRPALVSAVLVLVPLCVGIALLSTRNQDVLAATLEAMAQVKTAHIVSTNEEVWISVGKGVRREGLGRTLVYTNEGTWEHDADTNKVIIMEPDAYAVPEQLAWLSGTRWLEPLDEWSGQYRLSQVDLHGSPAKRIDIDPDDVFWQSDTGRTFWIHLDSMRIVVAEVWRRDEADEHTVLHRARIEYDAPMDPALFTLEFPPGATTVDCRLDPELAEVFREAKEAVRTLPVHEVGRDRGLLPGPAVQPGRWRTWEAWRQRGVGYREEHSSGEVQGGTIRERWRYLGRRGYIADQPALYPRGCALAAMRWLEDVQRGQLGPRKPRNPVKPEVTREERDGRRFARVTLHASYPAGNTEYDETPPRQERIYRECLFDLDAERLSQSTLYVWCEDQWHVIEDVELDYPDQLPPDIFQFDPPPGVEIDDRRNR